MANGPIITQSIDALKDEKFVVQKIELTIKMDTYHECKSGRESE